MLDFIKDNQTETPMEKQTKIAQSNIHAFKYTDEYFDQVSRYNENYRNLDPMYTKVQPIHEILVRCELHLPEKVGELIMPYKVFIPTNTKSGIDRGAGSEIESDFPFNTRAVVVSAPESNQLKPGDVVLLSRRAIQMNVYGNGANSKIIPEQIFQHPDSGHMDPVTDVTSPHYGYALVQYHEIKAKLND